MPDSMDDFLSGWVLHDSKLITYRLLSRARQLHVQDAKSALQAFYDTTHKRNPRALSAIYVLKGVLKGDGSSVAGFSSKPPAGGDNDGDETMTEELGPSQSASQPKAGGLSSSVSALGEPEEVPRIQMLLVSADQLNEAKARFATLTTAHVYSLGPGPDPTSSKKQDGQLTETTSEAARKLLPLLASVQHDLHTEKAYVRAWETAQRGRALGAIWNPDTVEEHSPSIGKTESAPGPGLSDKKLGAKHAVKAEGKTASDSSTSARPAAKPPAGKNSMSSKALESMLFPESESKKPETSKPAERSKPTPPSKSAAQTSANTKRTPSGAQKRSAPEPEAQEDEPAISNESLTEKEEGSKATSERATKRVKKTRTVTKTERFKDEKGYTVRRNVEVEEEYSTDESEDDRPKLSKVPKKESAAKPSSKAASPPPPRSAPSADSSKAQPPSKPASNPAPTKPKPAGFGANKAGSGSGAAAKKPVDKRQQTLGSFFKKK